MQNQNQWPYKRFVQIIIVIISIITVSIITIIIVYFLYNNYSHLLLFSHYYWTPKS